MNCVTCFALNHSFIEAQWVINGYSVCGKHIKEAALTAMAQYAYPKFVDKLFEN